MNKITKNILLFSTIAISFASCLKDKNFEDNKYGVNMTQSGTAGFSRGSKDTTPVVYAQNISATPLTDQTVKIVLENTDALKTDVVLTITKNSGLLAKVPGLAELASADYSFPATVTIPAGTNVAYIPITYKNTSTLTIGNFYGVGLTISAAANSGISIDKKNLLMEITLKNQYDGAYVANGFFYHPASPRPIINLHVDCITSAADKVITELGDLGTLIVLTISPTNQVTLTDLTGPVGITPTFQIAALPTVYTPFAGSNASIYNNTYDPATKSFYLRYGYMGGSGWRVCEEVLVRD